MSDTTNPNPSDIAAWTAAIQEIIARDGVTEQDANRGLIYAINTEAAAAGLPLIPTTPEGDPLPADAPTEPAPEPAPVDPAPVDPPAPVEPTPVPDPGTPATETPADLIAHIEADLARLKSALGV